MKKYFLLIFLFFIAQGTGYSKHLFKEKDYQSLWCMKNDGVSEYVLSDSSRVDCLTKNYAIEFDFAYKWKESIGQALYYSVMTGKKPGIVLIEEDSCKDNKYIQRLKKVANVYNIKVWIVNPSIFTKFCHSVENGVCR